MSEDDHDFRVCRCGSCRELFAANLQWRIGHEDRMYEMNGPRYE